MFVQVTNLGDENPLRVMTMLKEMPAIKGVVMTVDVGNRLLFEVVGRSLKDTRFVLEYAGIHGLVTVFAVVHLQSS